MSHVEKILDFAWFSRRLALNLKYGRRTACRDNFFTEMRYFPEKQGKGQQRGINPNLYKQIKRPCSSF